MDSAVTTSKTVINKLIETNVISEDNQDTVTTVYSTYDAIKNVYETVNNDSKTISAESTSDSVGE